MIRALVFWLILALPAAAQSLPDWDYTSINDFAGLLTNDDTRVLDQALIALHDDTGIEGTVVTLKDRASHGGGSGLEPFATRLFNYWGVGDRRRSDGFMVLILVDDREARIELGAGYPRSMDAVAATIMDDRIIPAFREGDYSLGIRQGTLGVIEKIARPHAARQGEEPAVIEEGQTARPVPIRTETTDTPAIDDATTLADGTQAMTDTTSTRTGPAPVTTGPVPPPRIYSTPRPAQQRERPEESFFERHFVLLFVGAIFLIAWFGRHFEGGGGSGGGYATSSRFDDDDYSSRSHSSSSHSSSSSSSSSSGGFGGGSSRGGGSSGKW